MWSFFRNNRKTILRDYLRKKTVYSGEGDDDKFKSAPFHSAVCESVVYFLEVNKFYVENNQWRNSSHHIEENNLHFKNKYNHIIPMTDNESNRNWKFVGTLQILHRWWDHLSWDKTLLNLKYKWINMYYKFISCPETTYCDEITYQVPRIESSANLTNRLQLLWQLHIFRTCIWI